MDELRKPFLVLGLILALLSVALETGASFWPREKSASAVATLGKGIEDAETREMLAKMDAPSAPRPGFGILSLALFDVLAVFTVGLMIAPSLIGDETTGRLQGCATFLVSLVILLGSVAGLFLLISLLMLMVSLLLAAPFGTVAYLVTWGFFDVGGAKVTLGILLMLKLGLLASLLLANQRFLKNKGLMIFFAISLLAVLIVRFLHAVVPSPIVSISDTLAAIIVVILALIWLIIMLVGSIISVVKVVT